MFPLFYIFFTDKYIQMFKERRRNMSLKERCKKFIDELGVQVAKFADNCGIGRSTYYQWQKGDIELSDKSLNKIDDYLKKYGF